MADAFSYDVFLSYSSKDKAVVRDIAQRLRADATPASYAMHGTKPIGKIRDRWSRVEPIVRTDRM